MATAILKELFEVQVTRTRDGELLSTMDIVYDVGDGEFDHHNVEKEKRDNGTPYAACGLIWRRYGKDVIRAREPELQDGEVGDIFKHIDRSLVEGIDASDNGVRTCITVIPTTNISMIISGFNPPWDADTEAIEKGFEEAVKLASQILDNMLMLKISSVKAKANVKEAYNNRIRPELLVLDKSYPWTYSLSEIDKAKEVLFVVYPRDDEYLVQTVRGGGSHGNRKSLPKAWAGKRDQELGEIVGIEDAIFCHPGRFIAGARSLESILRMADLAIAEPVEKVKKGFLYSLKKFLVRKFVAVK